VTSSAPPLLGWPDQLGLLDLGGDAWRVKDACEGTVIFGGTGSGKTSGSGRALARAFLDAGFGGLVLCAKAEEPSLWRRYAAEAGRERDLVMFGGRERWGFNFMHYESLRSGAGAGLTENLVSLFMEISSIGSGEARARGGDPFWERAMRSLVRNTVDVLLMAGEPVSLHAMFDVIRSAPQDAASLASPDWRARSGCWRFLEAARQRALGRTWEIDCREVAGYWLGHFPTLGEKTRGSIVAMFSTLAEALMRGKMRELFCEETSLTPEDAIAGRIVVVDLPVKEWSEVGRMAAVIWKYCLQKAVERRTDNEGRHGRPLFLWADECQHFASRYDTLFQATARSSRAASVYLTQNYPSLAAAFGGGADGRAMADALLGNLATKIFHANSDAETNRIASELVGRRLQPFCNSGTGTTLSLGGQASIGSSSSRGRSEHIDYEIQPSEFSRLRKGGTENGQVADALVFQNGRTWAQTGRVWRKVAFRQPPWDPPAPCEEPAPRRGRAR